MIDFSGVARAAKSARAGLTAFAVMTSATVVMAADGGVFGHAVPGQMKLIEGETPIAREIDFFHNGILPEDEEE